MWIPVLILSILSYGVSHPVDSTTSIPETSDVESLHKDLGLVSYIQNFKHVMAQYVNGQYKNLTVEEIEKVKLTLEDFLKNFAADLRDTLEGNNNEEYIENTNDETFSDIKSNIIKEFPDVTPEVADRIVFKLKQNLYQTRHRLDEIIKESQRGHVENSQ